MKNAPPIKLETRANDDGSVYIWGRQYLDGKRGDTDTLGPVILFDFVQIDDKTILKATCHEEQVEEVFDALCAEVAAFFDGEEPAKPEKHFDEICNLVERNLDSLDPKNYHYTRETRTLSNLYTVTRTGELLGRFRVENRPGTGVIYGPIQGDGPLWNMIWEIVLVQTLQRAEGKLTDEMEREYKRRQELYRKQIQEQAETEKPEEPASLEMIEHTRILQGQYDWLCIEWVNRPSVPYRNKREFLEECAPSLTIDQFKDILKNAERRGIIRRNEKNRFVPV
jgi:hypothetical protein